jgi:hypothetical protein
MKKIYDAVATVGKYTDSQGNEKKRYVTIGAVFENDKGQMSMKLESLPVGPEWSGWVSFYEPKAQNRQESQRPAQQRQAPARSSNTDTEEEIPF